MMIVLGGARTILGTNIYTDTLTALINLTFTHPLENKQIKKAKARVKTFSNGSVILSVRKC